MRQVRRVLEVGEVDEGGMKEGESKWVRTVMGGVVEEIRREVGVRI